MQILKTAGGITALVLASACAAPSVQHTAQSVDHSAQATSHGGSAVASGVATASAVPVIAAGSVLAVTGAALKDVGTASLNAGTELFAVSTGGPQVTQCANHRVTQQAATCVVPNGPPRLN